MKSKPITKALQLLAWNIQRLNHRSVRQLERQHRGDYVSEILYDVEEDKIYFKFGEEKK